MPQHCPRCQHPITIPGVEYTPQHLTCSSCGQNFERRTSDTITFVRNGTDDTVTYVSAPPQQLSPTINEAKEFGGYELLHEIARGGMGIVYKAQHRSLNRVVALKMIKAGELAGDEEIKRFRSEAGAAAQLDHPNIVPIYEVGEYDGQHFFSMGFVDGKSLADRLKDGPLAPQEAAVLVQTIAEAIQFAHDKGIVHRDLKPANVLLDGDGKPRVTDFGLAKNTSVDSGLTATGQVMGTPSYMPPEQARGDVAHVGPKSDVYSLGAILFALLTGRPPFQAAHPVETLKQVLEDEPVSPRVLNRAVDRDLETICLKALDKDPTNRYDTAADFASDLSRYCDGKPILARPISRFACMWRWCRRNRSVAVLSMAVLVSLFGGLAASSYYAYTANQHADALDFALTGEREERRRADNNAKRFEAESVKARQAEQKANEAKTAADQARIQVQQSLFNSIDGRLAQSNRLMTPVEQRALQELTELGSDLVREQYLQYTLRDAASAKRIRSRSYFLMLALTGLDLQRRKRMQSLLFQQLKNPDAPGDVRRGAAYFLVNLQTDDAAVFDLVLDELVEELNPPKDRPIVKNHAEKLDVVVRQLQPEFAAPHLLSKIRETTDTRTVEFLAYGFISALTRLEPSRRADLANQAAQLIVMRITQLSDRNSSSRVLASVLEQLAPYLRASDAKTVAHRFVPRFRSFASRYETQDLCQSMMALIKRMEKSEAHSMQESLAVALAAQIEKFRASTLGGQNALKGFAIVADPDDAQSWKRVLAVVAKDAKDPDADISSIADVLSQAGKQLPQAMAQEIATILVQKLKRGAPSHLHKPLLKALKACFESFPAQQDQRFASILLSRLESGAQHDVIETLAFGLAVCINKSDPKNAQTISAAATAAIMNEIRKPSTQHREIAALAEGLRTVNARKSQITEQNAREAFEILLTRFNVGKSAYSSILIPHSVITEGLNAVTDLMDAKVALQILLNKLRAMSSIAVNDPLIISLQHVGNRLTPEAAGELLSSAIDRVKRTRFDDRFRTAAIGLRIVARKIDAKVLAPQLIRELKTSGPLAIHSNNDPLGYAAIGLIAIGDDLSAEQANEAARLIQGHIQRLRGGGGYVSQYLAEAFGAMAKRLEPKQRRLIADQIGSELARNIVRQRETSYLSYTNLWIENLALMAVVDHLEPTKAQRFIADAAQVTIGILEKTKSSYTATGYFMALHALAARLSPTDAARATKALLAQMAGNLSSANVMNYQFSITLRATCDQLDATGAEQTANVLLSLLSDPQFQENTRYTSAAAPMIEIFPTIVSKLNEEGLLKTLKHPLCVNSYQQAVLQQLSRIRGQDFHTVWEYVERTEHKR